MNHLLQMQENLHRALEYAIQELQNDPLYLKHKQLLETALANNQTDDILTAQMTLHNMELEAVYYAGHRDCCYYLSHIGALPKQ